ncbi:MAG: ParB/RepB/Spo0J family partition protein [Porticoccaceae bacterium]|nr:ParB/RepB/Spo0J family partition protein [Porticoccaceae bacterium]
MSNKRQSLGKGLDALMGDYGADDSNLAQVSPATLPLDRQIKDLPVEFLQRGKYQPRRDLDRDTLDELAASIEAQGVMQPIVVRELSSDRYEIIAGERRWRASQQVGLATIPAIIRDIDDQTAIAMALIENIQRENLNPMEESSALIRLQQEFYLTQQQVADSVGKSRSSITNLMRLANLEPRVQEFLERRDLDLGHAKCLLALEGEMQVEAAYIVSDGRLSVRQTEVLVKRLQSASQTNPLKKEQQPDIVSLQRELSDRLGTAVSIQHRASGRGKLVFSYNSMDELDGILEHLK